MNSKEKRNKKKESDKLYRRSLNGLIRRSYSQIKQRIKGNCRTPEIYRGLAILSQQEFLDFSSKCETLKKLHEEWIKTGYDTRFTPSLDRIDEKQGYILSNIRWITHEENSRRAGLKKSS